MKLIDMESVYKKAQSTTKKIKVNEAVVGLQSAMNDINAHSGVKIDDTTYNIIVTYFALQLLAITHNEKEYDEIFESCLVEEDKEESEA